MRCFFDAIRQNFCNFLNALFLFLPFVYIILTISPVSASDLKKSKTFTKPLKTQGFSDIMYDEVLFSIISNNRRKPPKAVR